MVEGPQNHRKTIETNGLGAGNHLMLNQSDSRKPERAMSDCQGQLPLREQQAKVSNLVKLYQNCVFQDLSLLLVKKCFVFTFGQKGGGGSWPIQKTLSENTPICLTILACCSCRGS